MQCPFCHASTSSNVRACHVCGGPLQGIKRLVSPLRQTEISTASSFLIPNTTAAVGLNKEIARAEPVLVARISREKNAPRIVSALFWEEESETYPLFVLESGEMQMWDVRHDELHRISSRRTLYKASLTIASTYSPHCGIVATGLESGQIRLQRLESRGASAGWNCHVLGMVEAHRGCVLSLATAETRLYSAGNDGAVVMTNLPNADYDREDKKSIVVLDGLSSLSCLALSPDGRFLALGADDGQVQMWRLGEDGIKARLDWTSSKDQSRVKSLLFTPNGNMLLSCNAGGQLCLWATQTGHRLQRMAQPDGLVTPAFASNSRLLAHTNLSEGISLCDAWTGELMHTLPAVAGGAQSLDFLPSSEIDARETLLIVTSSQQIAAWKVFF